MESMIGRRIRVVPFALVARICVRACLLLLIGVDSPAARLERSQSPSKGDLGSRAPRQVRHEFWSCVRSCGTDVGQVDSRWMSSAVNPYFRSGRGRPSASCRAWSASCRQSPVSSRWIVEMDGRKMAAMGLSS